jgi:hypothetical protein
MSKIEIDSIKYMHTLSSSAHRLANRRASFFVEGPQGTGCVGKYGAGFM